MPHFPSDDLASNPTGDETIVIGKASKRSKLTQLADEMMMQHGTLVRMRARYADGTSTDWAKARTEPSAPRSPAVALQRIALVALGNGLVSMKRFGPHRPVAEPSAQLEFINHRTHEKCEVVLTDAGAFPANFQLKGNAGDSFSVAAKVGTASFTQILGHVTVPGGTPAPTDMPDPSLHKDELDSSGKPKFRKVRFSGPLGASPPRAEDVRQGYLNNSYFAAALASIAKHMPDAIGRLIKDNGDQTYTVTFKQRSWDTRNFSDVSVKVDGDLYVRASGEVLYGRTSGKESSDLWFSLIEKAYAQWKGSYNAIGNGGHVGDVFEDCLGIVSSSLSITPSNIEVVWNQIVASVDAKKPLGAGTAAEDTEAAYTNTGVYANHAYAVLGYEMQGTQRSVVLSTPWGAAMPAGKAAEATLRLPIEVFGRLFQSLYF